jgi:hypothetical protein
MKYVVELKYTNPAHDHVTLRRRVDTVNRIVEAKSEDEALNRAANQQRALGFKIQEAKIVEQPKAPVKTEQLSEATVKDLRTTLKAMDLRHGVDADKRDAGYKKSPAVAAAQKKFDAQAAGQGKMRPQAGTLAAKVAAKKLGEETEVQYIEEKLTAADPASKWISDFVASENPKFAGKSKKERINMALGAYYSAKRGGDMKEGYDPSSAEIAKMLVKKHGAGNVTKQHILDLEMDRDSMKGLDHDEIMKHVAKMDEAVSFGRSGGVMHYNPKTEKSEKEGTAKLYDPAKHDKKLSPKGGFAKMKKEEVEAIEEAKQVDHAKTIAKSLAATHPNFRVSSYDGDYGRAHVVHHKSDTRNFRNGEELMGPNIQLQHNHETNKVHMEMQGDFDNVPDRDEETHHPDQAHEAAHKMFKPAVDLIHKTDKTTTNEEVEQVDEAQKKLKPSYWRAEWRLGTKSEVDKNNKKIYDKLAKTDPEKAAKFHDNLMKMRKEEIEAIKEANTRVVNKEVKKEKAAETAVAAARRAKNTKNKVEMEPKLDMNVAGSEKKYVTKV